MSEWHSWGEDLQKLRRGLNRAIETAHGLRGQMSAVFDSTDFPGEIAALLEDLSQSESLAKQLSERLSSGPLGKLVSGRPMSREEFYLLVAAGIWRVTGSFTGDPYDDCQMLRYEDDKLRGYIDLDEAPSGRRVKVHIGIWPEQIVWERLRPDQQEFFTHCLPEVVPRFKREGPA